LNRVTMDFVWNMERPRGTRDPGIPQERLNRYRRLLREADVPEGFLRPGMGYAFSSQPLEPIVESLDQPDSLAFGSGPTGERAYMPLRDGWLEILGPTFRVTWSRGCCRATCRTSVSSPAGRLLPGCRLSCTTSAVVPKLRTCSSRTPSPGTSVISRHDRRAVEHGMKLTGHGKIGPRRSGGCCCGRGWDKPLMAQCGGPYRGAEA